MLRVPCTIVLAIGLTALGTADAQLAVRYRADTYTTEHGLPSQALTSIAQTTDGFVWVAAGGILARFDGHEFVSYPARAHPALKRRVTHVLAGRGDTLWVIDEGGAVLAVARGRVTEIVRPSATRLIGVIAQDAAGVLYGAGSKIWRLGRGADSSVQVALHVKLPALAEQHMLRDRAGTVWIVDADSALQAVNGSALPGRPNAHLGLVTSPSTGEVFTVRRRNGRERNVVRANGDVVATYTAGPFIMPKLVDRDGRLWVTTPDSYDVYERGSARPVARIPGRTAGLAPRLIELQAGCIVSLELAVRNLCRVPFRMVSERLRVDQFRRGPGGRPIVIDETGRLVVLSADSTSRELTGPSSRVRATAYAFAADERVPGSVWYATGGYVYHASVAADGRLVDGDSVATGGEVTALAAGDGSVWVAVKGDGDAGRLLHARGRRVTTYTSADGLPSTALRALLVDADGTVWLGTYGGGLARLRNGRFSVVTEANGLREDVATSVLDDGLGNIWMGGNRGIHRVSRRDLDDFFAKRSPRVHGVTYGRADGLLEPETTGASGLRDDEGLLWFHTIAGAVIVDPAMAIALDSTPPLVHVVGLRSDRDTVHAPAGSQRVTKGARQVVLTFTSTPSRNDAAVRFEYRLDGVDRDWISATGAREAVYNNVAAGTHVFRVRAYNAGGVRSAQDATVEVVVPHFFRETTAFFALVLLLIGGGGWCVVLYRERLLRRREAVLRRAVEERTATLELALGTVASQADQLRTLDEAKSRFFANVSHEFRTPLSLIIGPVEDLRDGRSGELPTAARRRLDAVLGNARRLLQLVEQLLDVARLESGRLELSAEVRDLVPLLRRLAESFASLAERRGVAFQLSCPVGGKLRLRYDPDRMEKIVSNLLSNALKFTPAGGTVELRASVDGDAWAVVEVEDNGPGIAAEHQARVFERFFQVDDSSRRAHEGTGIGLALVRELVELHGGTVELRSELGTGSTFTVRLPLATAADVMVHEPVATPFVAPLAHESTAVVHPDAPRTIATDATTVLIVEDNEELLAFLRDHLADRYRVLSAENGLRGLEVAREKVPDLIISDVMMPHMDGQSLCEAVKHDPDIDFIPVILLTAKASRDSRLSGLTSGADDYLTKPVDLAELLVRAENLIASRRRVRERWHAADQPLPAISAPMKQWPTDLPDRTMLAAFNTLMAEHLGDEGFNVDAMATALGLGRSTMYRKLEPILGMSPMDALWEYRLAQAAQWLAQTPITVSEVAYGVGFKSVPHFCGRFRQRYGETPSAYRRAHTLAPTS